MTTVIPLKKGWRDELTGEFLDSMVDWEHHEQPETDGEVLMLTLTDEQTATLAAMLFNSLGKEKVIEAFDDPELLAALERYENHD